MHALRWRHPRYIRWKRSWVDTIPMKHVRILKNQFYEESIYRQRMRKPLSHSEADNLKGSIASRRESRLCRSQNCMQMSLNYRRAHPVPASAVALYANTDFEAYPESANASVLPISSEMSIGLSRTVGSINAALLVSDHGLSTRSSASG